MTTIEELEKRIEELEKVNKEIIAQMDRDQERQFEVNKKLLETMFNMAEAIRNMKELREIR
jgi:hypothetical protein